MKLLCAEYNEAGEVAYNVAERFAERYYEEVGVGIRFYADNLERELLAASLSPAAAMAFDSSAAISPMKSLVGISLGSMIFSFELNGESIFTRRVSEISRRPEETLAVMSEYYMLKIGDFLFCGGTSRQRISPTGEGLRILLEIEC